ncbi:MAG: efflux RND transporter periplasmic adaptor subunit [Oxalobacter sp.]|nr:MAG: efflux RND transporter periplasmic adaptor subunit [Oxalobacter sp.]
MKLPDATHLASQHLSNARRKRWGLAVLVLTGVALTVGIAMKKRATASNGVDPSGKAVPAMEFLPSDVTRVKLGDLRKVLPLTGTLRAVNQAAIKAKVSAEVREVLVREGETVKQGQVLIKMDASEYQAKVDQARGALQAAQGQLDIATQTRNNNKALLEKNFISKNAFDNAQSQYQIAVSNVKSARGAYDVAQKALNDTVIRAPIAGQISARSIQPGEKVSTDNKLLEVVDLRLMEVEATVPVGDIVNVAIGQEVSLKIEGFPEAMVGKVKRINPSIQAGSRSIPIYIQVDNSQGLLKMGMFAEARLTLTKKTNVLSIPQSAVQKEGDKLIVYAIENNVLKPVVVTPGMSGDDGDGAESNAVEILSGLEKEMLIVRVNLGNLQAGTPVRFTQAASSENSSK